MRKEGICFGLNLCSWLVSRGQWSEEETDEEEDDDVSPLSGPPESGLTKAGKAEGDLQINVEDEEAFVLPPAGEVEQDILGVQSEGWRRAPEEGFLGL